MTFRRISTEEALAALIEDDTIPEDMAEGMAQNIRNGHLIAGRDLTGKLAFRITEEGKRYVENMGRDDADGAS